MRRRWRAGLIAGLSAALLGLQGVALSGPATAGTNQTTQHLTFQGTFTPSTVGQGHGVPGTTEIPPHQPNSKTIRHTAAAGVPSVSGSSVAQGQVATFGGFSGLTHADQRNAGTGVYENSQYSLEPPDQGLCVGGGYVVEAVNNAMQVFGTDGTAETNAIALSQLFGLNPEVNRNGYTSVPDYGPFISDPRCYYDTQTSRWFLTELLIGVDPTTGAFVGHSELVLAVSATADPTGTWNIYTLNTTDDGTGGTPSDSGCPCFGDQPLIGADANGFYITTNEYSIFGPAFNGAMVYAFSKTGVESGSNLGATRLALGDATIGLPNGGQAFSLQPATSPAGGFDSSAGGTAYFMSATDWGAAPALGTRADRVLVWALTNTSSLNTTPNLKMDFAVVNSELYAQPPNATQKKGPLELGSLVHSPLELVATNDDRMNQVVYANGKLWGGLNTAVKTQNGATTTGIAYFVAAPSVDSTGTVSATMASQGYLAVNGASVIFPSIGVTSGGKALMAFSLVGPGYYPSAAYAPLSLTAGAGPVYVAAAGTGPDDGFSGYRAFGGNGVGRWGDYSAAVATPGGTVWMASEYIPNAPRTIYANWGTFVYHVTP